jgi:hypothetical protein
MSINIPSIIWSAMRALGLNEVTREDPVRHHIEDDNSYEPSPVDIAVVRAMLYRAKKLPPDLIDAIFDFAEYWAHSTTQLHERVSIMGGSEDRENKFLVSRPHLVYISFNLLLTDGATYSFDHIPLVW